MSVMFEVYYESQPDEDREATITGLLQENGGNSGHGENPPSPELGSICLTYEFDDRKSAEAAASLLRQRGEHVEGRVEYAS